MRARQEEAQDQEKDDDLEERFFFFFGVGGGYTVQVEAALHVSWLAGTHRILTSTLGRDSNLKHSILSTSFNVYQSKIAEGRMGDSSATIFYI